MQFVLGPDLIVTFLLASTRLLATLIVAPPFNGGMVPVRIRLGLAVTIGLLLATGPLPGDDRGSVPLDTAGLVLAIGGQVLAGLTFGFTLQLLLAAFQTAGSIIDLSSGLSAGTLYDPLTQTQVGPVGRLYQIVSLVVLVSMNGHLMVVRGIVRSFEAAPLTAPGTVDLGTLGATMTEASTRLLMASLEVAFPVFGALLLTDMALGIATRAAPRMNILAVGFGVKSMVLFLVLGLGLPLLANATMNLLDAGLRSGGSLLEG